MCVSVCSSFPLSHTLLVWCAFFMHALSNILDIHKKTHLDVKTSIHLNRRTDAQTAQARVSRTHNNTNCGSTSLSLPQAIRGLLYYTQSPYSRLITVVCCAGQGHCYLIVHDSMLLLLLQSTQCEFASLVSYDSVTSPLKTSSGENA